MNYFEKIKQILTEIGPMDKYSPVKHLWPTEVMAILSYAEDMQNEIQKLTKESELYRITINAENDRLDRNNQLEAENEALKLKEKSYIHDMNAMFKAYQDHICRSCGNDECANSYPGDGSDLDFCEYWKQR